VHVLEYDKLTESQKEKADKYFTDVVYPVLTPLALDTGHPFPHISNLSLNLAIVIRDKKGNEKFARLKVPDTLPRLVPIKRSSGAERKDGTIPHHHYFVWLEQVIAANLANVLFPGMEVVSAHPFRIVRDADIEIQELEADDLLETMQQNIRKRKFGSVVQVAVYPSMPESIRDLLVDNLEVTRNDVYTLHHPLGLGSLWQLYSNVERRDLKDTPLQTAFQNRSGPFLTRVIFSMPSARRISLHHPYDSFSPVIDFLTAAARDPHVLAIKQTVYRVGDQRPRGGSPARSRRTRQTGGCAGGTQSPLRRRIKHRLGTRIGAGGGACRLWIGRFENALQNYHGRPQGRGGHPPLSAPCNRQLQRRHLPHLRRLGIFTCDEDMGADATDLFNYLTGYSTKQDYKKLLIAPVNLRQKIESLIKREIEHAQAGKKARIIFKMNSLVDDRMIQLLYQASQAGVKVDLLVRGMCCLRPGSKASAKISAWSAWWDAILNTAASIIFKITAMMNFISAAQTSCPATSTTGSKWSSPWKAKLTSVTCATKCWSVTSKTTPAPASSKQTAHTNASNQRMVKSHSIFKTI
jgi:polyphosphate kinase